ncbi:hypothetical protein DFP72DRAFT_1072778 [Ephemerocybe angulata]|uniref:Uncharacterized protein n=1 Tax=Ephemerocybe angulata TaxID=980116 RepID=A0A8H6HMP0_9AGAR|nr:hypothetical protein DFP72DRAFT_1072778 [Tulosesus angulatus]
MPHFGGIVNLWPLALSGLPLTSALHVIEELQTRENNYTFPTNGSIVVPDTDNESPNHGGLRTQDWIAIGIVFFVIMLFALSRTLCCLRCLCYRQKRTSSRRRQPDLAPISSPKELRSVMVQTEERRRPPPPLRSTRRGPPPGRRSRSQAQSPQSPRRPGTPSEVMRSPSPVHFQEKRASGNLEDAPTLHYSDVPQRVGSLYDRPRIPSVRLVRNPDN